MSNKRFTTFAANRHGGQWEVLSVPSNPEANATRVAEVGTEAEAKSVADAMNEPELGEIS